MKIKGFIFTIDAIFSLIVAGAGISILVYAFFLQPIGYQSTAAQAASVEQALLDTSLAQAAQGSQYALAASNGSSSGGSFWPWYGENEQLQSSSNVGPLLPMLLFQFNTQNAISSPISVGNGEIAFASGKQLFVLNATTGNVVSSNSYPGNVLYPYIADQKIYYDYSGLNGHDATGPIAVEDNLAVYPSGNTLVFTSLSNSVALYTITANYVTTPAFGDDEFFVTGSSTTQQNYIEAYSIVGGSLVRTWSRALNAYYTSSPIVIGNDIFVINGGGVIAYTTGGKPLYSVGDQKNNINLGVFYNSTGNLAGNNQGIFTTVYNTTSRIVPSCKCVLQNYTMPVTTTNVTPAITPTTVYELANTSQFIAFNISSGKKLWNVSVHGSFPLKYGGISLGYGNAYFASGNTVYAFGTCKGNPGESLLQAIASMYLNNEGGCANMLLNQSYGTSQIAMFINNTYAQSLNVGSFTGNSAIYAINSQNPKQNFSISMWVNPNVGGPVADIYSASNNYGIGSGQGTDYGGAYVRPSAGVPSYFEWDEGTQKCATNSGTISAGSWYNVVVSVSNYNSISIYINGALAKQCLLSSAEPSLAKPAFSIGVNPVTFSTAYNGLITNVQFFKGTLNSSQAYQEYSDGFGYIPIESGTVSLIGYWPLLGDSNDYSGHANVGYPYNISYTSTNFTPSSINTSFQVSKASVPLAIGTMQNGQSFYNVSIVVWR